MLGFIFSREISSLSARYNKELYRGWAEEHVANAEWFVIRLFLGRGQYDVRTAKTLKEARQIKRDMVTEYEKAGENLYGRRPTIYAITKGMHLTIHVE